MNTPINVMTINLIGLLLMAAVVIWFWLWRTKAVAVIGENHVIEIKVANGVYNPDVIALRRGETATLRFHRLDPSPCAEQVVFHGLNISESLPIDGQKDIRVTPTQAGTFRFSCQMNMYQGELRVSE